MDVNEKVKDIKAQFRLFMNGVVSQSMREKGLVYKINFGIELPRLKEIAEKYEKDHQLAQALWKENIRECKIIATFLQPLDSFIPEIADIWVDDIKNPELVEISCMNLFQHLPYASEKAFEWIASDEEYHQLCGYMLLSRLFMKKATLNERAEAEFLDQTFTALEYQHVLICKAAATALKKYGHQNKDNAKKLSKLLSPLLKSSKEEIVLLASDIKMDVEY